MEENTFFKWVWRFNGVVISVAGVLAIGVLLFVGNKLLQDMTRERKAHNVVNIETRSEVKEHWRLGSMAEVRGHPVVMVPLHSDQKYNQSYYNKISLSVRNYLFINTETSSNQWLFDHNNYLIENREYLRSGMGDTKKNVTAILYSLIQFDTNSDKRLAVTDLKTIALTKPNGAGYKEVLKNVEQFFGSKSIDSNSLLVLYQRNGVGYSVKIDLTEFTLTNETELPHAG
jgi:hypothetical protein